MTEQTTASPDLYGRLTEPATLRIQRLLPGPAERVWAYLIDGELRRKWLAAGALGTGIDADFELVWRNDDLSDAPTRRPAGMDAESRMQCRVIAYEPQRRLSFTWIGSGNVTIELEPSGAHVLLTLIHERLPGRDTLVSVSAGWHAHLDLLVAAMDGGQRPSFWEHWLALRNDYDSRLPR